jgi:hypothetical protein
LAIVKLPVLLFPQALGLQQLELLQRTRAPAPSHPYMPRRSGTGEERERGQVPPRTRGGRGSGVATVGARAAVVGVAVSGPVAGSAIVVVAVAAVVTARVWD